MPNSNVNDEMVLIVSFNGNLRGRNAKFDEAMFDARKSRF